MISNKSKAIILLGGIMLSSAAFTIGTNNNNYPKNTAVYAINKNASENEASKITNTAIINEVKDNNVNEESTNKEEVSNVDTNVAANSINTTDVSEENFVERESSAEKFSTVDSSVAVNNSNVNTSNSNNNVVDSNDEKVENVEISDEVSNNEKTDVDSNVTEVEIENNDKIESDTNNDESKVDLDNNNVDSDTNNNIIASETQDNEIEDSNVNTDIAIAGSTITCPELSEAPTFNVNDGINANGIGDSVYEHLKGLGWTVIDENTIKINDDRLQFKNMNGQGGVDSIITITADFAENDKYVLYLLKLMIGDKSISTANPTESEIYSGAFDDTYYDNFENLVRRIANGTGTIKYSNRNIRVQYDGNWDYTITITFYNYTDENTSNVSNPSINGSINILY